MNVQSNLISSGYLPAFNHDNYTCVYATTSNPPADANGLYNVTLGVFSVIADPSFTDASGGDLHATAGTASGMGAYG